MRKIILMASCLILFLMMIGCESGGLNASSGQGSELSVSATGDSSEFLVATLSKEQAELIFDSTNKKESAPQYFDDFDHFSGRVGYCVYSEQAGYHVPFCWGLYDFETGELEKSGEVKDFVVASGHDVIMQGRYNFFWYSNGTENCFARLDYDKKKIEVLDKETKSRPLIYLNKISEDEFISFSSWREGEEEISLVEKCDINGNRTPIIEERYRNVEEEPNSTGNCLEQVCAKDGIIYGVGREKIDREYRCFFYQYDTDGNLLSKTEAPQLNEMLKDTIPLEISVFKNYMLVRDFNMQQALYHISGDKIEVVVDKTEGYHFPLYLWDYYDSDKISYLCYGRAGGNQLTKDTKETAFYVLDRHSGVTTKIQVDIDPEFPYFGYLMMDQDNNFVLTMEKEKSDYLRKYFISKETLDSLVKQAKS